MATRELIKEAIRDAQAIREVAVREAERRVLERLSPEIRRAIDENMAVATPEDVDRLRRANDGYGDSEFDESKGEPQMGKKMSVKEEIRAMFPSLNERGLPDDEGPMDEMGGIPSLDDDEPKAEAAVPQVEAAEEDDMGEAVEISNEELTKAYEGIMRLNGMMNETSVDWSPDVSKGFKDTYPGTEWDTEDKPPNDKGLMDKGPDGKGWEETKPPKKQDYTVKEALEKALSENEVVREYVHYLEEQIDGAAKLVRKMQREVHETALFNSKVMAVNEIFAKLGRGLTREQKEMVIERVDEAKSVRDVKLVSSALKSTFESVRKPKAPVAEAARKRGRVPSKPARTGGVDPKVLNEDRQTKSGYDASYSRLNQLAGLDD